MSKLSITFFSLVGLLAMTALQANPAQQTAVTFDRPEKFTDFRVPNMSAKRSRIALMEDLVRDVGQSLDRLLPAGSSMQVDITNIDMAGRIDPFSQPDELRLLRDYDKAELNFNYRWLSAEGSLLKEDTVTLRNNNLQTLKSRSNKYSHTRLAYEMAMFDKWLRKLVKDSAH